MTLWRNCPSLITGACLFLALCLCFIWSGIENFRAAADLAGTTIFTFTGSLIGFRQFKHMRIGMAFVAGGISGMITAVGGGTVRTLLLGLDFNDLFWVNNADYLIAMIIGFAGHALGTQNVFIVKKTGMQQTGQLWRFLPAGRKRYCWEYSQRASWWLQPPYSTF